MTETSDVEAEFQIDDSPQPDAQLDAAQSESLVRSALAELSAEQMRVIELSFFEEKAHGEIARILEIPLGTVKSRLRLAMNRLRGLLGELSMTLARHPDDIRHHPEASMLMAFAAGTLDRGQHVAIATHLVGCPRCRSWVRSMEQVGGTVLASLPPAAMSSDALARAEARLNDTGTPPMRIEAPQASFEVSTAGLPRFVRRYRFGDWQWVAPRVHLRPIVLPVASPSRVFLLRSGAGTRMLAHSHAPAPS